MQQRKPFKFSYDFTCCEVIAFLNFVSCSMYPQNGAVWHMCFVKAVVDRKVPILGNINITRMVKIAN